MTVRPLVAILILASAAVLVAGQNDLDQQVGDLIAEDNTTDRSIGEKDLLGSGATAYLGVNVTDHPGQSATNLPFEQNGLDKFQEDTITDVLAVGRNEAEKSIDKSDKGVALVRDKDELSSSETFGIRCGKKGGMKKGGWGKKKGWGKKGNKKGWGKKGKKKGTKGKKSKKGTKEKKKEHKKKEHKKEDKKEDEKEDKKEDEKEDKKKDKKESKLHNLLEKLKEKKE